MKKVAIVQSNYIPWKGYFDMIAAVDEFILFDDVQYTRRDWRNRNYIKTPNGVSLLTVPVQVKGKYHQLIRDTEINGNKWAESHWKSLCQNYKQADYFDDVIEDIKKIYLEMKFKYLSVLNRTLIEFVCDYLGIETRITNSWDYPATGRKSEKLVEICTQAGASEYISGPTAKNYIDESVFAEHGIKLTWFDYSGYPEYPQLWGEFRHDVSILDMLFNCGRDAPKYMRYVAH